MRRGDVVVFEGGSCGKKAPPARQVLVSDGSGSRDASKSSALVGEEVNENNQMNIVRNLRVQNTLLDK